MKRTFVAASIAALATVYACSDSTSPLTQEQLDEALAVSVSGSGVDPNAETAGGHTATPPAVTCSYSATTQWTTCGPSTHNGLTVTREMQFLDSSDAPQQMPNTTTRSMKSKTTVAGTLIMKTQTAIGTTTISRTSEETVTGLGPASARVVNGTASGAEDSEGTDARGTMAVKRIYADTTTGMTFPAVFNPASPWPTAGKIVRNMKASAAFNGATAKDYSSREEQTFEAGGKLTIRTTMNGQTRTCVVQLGPMSMPVCTQG
jgi:hypothetical protein